MIPFSKIGGLWKLELLHLQKSDERSSALRYVISLQKHKKWLVKRLSRQSTELQVEWIWLDEPNQNAQSLTFDQRSFRTRPEALYYIHVEGA